MLSDLKTFKTFVLEKFLEVTMKVFLVFPLDSLKCTAFYAITIA